MLHKERWLTTSWTPSKNYLKPTQQFGSVRFVGYQLTPKYIQIKIKCNNQQNIVHLFGEINWVYLSRKCTE